jgi:hypothetical protein
MSNHTPGPWYTAYSETNQFGGGNIRSNYHADGPGALLFSAEVMFHDYTVDREEELANLHLAASAPELLAALEDIVEDIRDDESFSSIEDHALLVRAKEAIAKAKGEA